MITQATDAVERRAPLPTRIVFVTDNLGFGGAERHLVRLLAGLHASPHWDVSVYCLSRHGEFIASLEAGGIEVSGSMEPWTRSLTHFWRVTHDLYRYFRRTRPDIAHCYMVYGGFLGAIAARAAGVPYVLTTRRIVHGYRGRGFIAYCLVHAVMDRLSDGVIAVCQTARVQAEREGTPTHKTYTVYNSIDLPMPARGPTFTGSPIFGTVCSLAPRKGLSFLLDAIPGVLAVLPHSRFVLVGDGPERDALQLQAQRVGVSAHVEFLGARDDVAALLQAFDLFVLPSLLEGMPNALLEAMAAGLPVVATAVGGVPEFIEPERTGLIVPPASAEALAGAMVRLATDEELRSRCARGAREMVATRFRVDREVGDTEAIYRQVLARPVQRLFKLWGGKVP